MRRREILHRFHADRRGATAIEYGLIAALIAVAAIGGMQNYGNGLKGMYNHVDQTVGNANN